MALVTAIHLRGTRAAQPAASSANAGYIYCVTDEGNILERSSGSAWQAYSPTGSGSGTVTNTGALASGAIVKGNGGVDVSTTSTAAGILTFLDTPSSANLATAVTDETGSGALVFATSPTLVTPLLGTPTSGTFTSAILGSVTAYLHYQEQQTQGTTSGTFTSGAWRTRVLNTEVSDAGGYGTLASNQITLTAGTYYITAKAPAFNCDRHQLRLQNVTDATTVITGLSGQIALSSATSSTHAFLTGQFTIGASKALELQHQCQTTSATRGFGIEDNFTTEIFADVELWRLA